MSQVARQLTDPFDGPLRDARFLIMDRDTKFTAAFKAVLRREGVEPALCPARASNCNAYAERFVRSIKEECLAQVIPIGTRTFRRAVSEYLAHYHLERNHQGIANRIIQPARTQNSGIGRVLAKRRLGGLLNYYHREAA